MSVVPSDPEDTVENKAAKWGDENHYQNLMNGRVDQTWDGRGISGTSFPSPRRPPHSVHVQSHVIHLVFYTGATCGERVDRAGRRRQIVPNLYSVLPVVSRITCTKQAFAR